MTTIFSRIIAGEIPGTFVHRDDRCVAFMSINPLARGHVLVVPIEEVDHWIDAPADLVAHLFDDHPSDRTRAEACLRLRPGRCDHRRLRGAARTHPRRSPRTNMGQLSFDNAATSVDPHELERRPRPSAAAMN